MFSHFIRYFIQDLRCKNQLYRAISRHGHTLRGNWPGNARTLQDRISSSKELSVNINIGFPQLKTARSAQLKHLSHAKSQQRVHEERANSSTFQIDLNQVREDSSRTNGQHHLVTVAKHYGIFKDLFGTAYFVPRIPLIVKFNISDRMSLPVNYGNIIHPSEAKNAPHFEFDASIDLITGKKTNEVSYWTLVLTNPDGHFSGEAKEYVHWLISNIPNGNMEKGEIIIPYIQPYTPKGLGYQRFIFVLYKQSKKMNFNSLKVQKLNDLENREFSTLDFYSKYQTDITPAGLAFFQSHWDASLTDFYQNVLELKEPCYEYDFSEPFLGNQSWFPLKQPFNVYMDKHRDQKQINKEYLTKKLNTTHPFEKSMCTIQYPNGHPINNVPSWLKTEMKKNRLGIGRINDYK